VGKSFALNEGDRLAGDVFPRLYCDADLRLSPSSITALVETLSTEDVKVAGPAVRYTSEGSTWTVRMYVRALASAVIAGWNNEHLMGRGLYGASRAARRRFEVFPDLTADDLFFDAQFGPTEKVIVPNAIATAWVPANLRALIRGEIRVAEGNREYRVAEFEDDSVTDRLVKRPKRFARWLGDRLTSLRDLRTGDVMPILVYIGIREVARTVLFVRRSRGRRVDWR
jgi:hypothetical protein